MKNLAMVLLIVSLSLGPSPVSAAAPDAEAAHRHSVDLLFADYAGSGGPGAAVGIYRDGRIVYSRGYGWADLEHSVPITTQTRFHVASISKQFTAFAIALLARDGKVDLDADIRKYLPFVPDFGPANVITVRHLLHHTSGLRDQWNLFSMGGHDYQGLLEQQQILNLVARQKELNFSPGSEHLYCNTGFTLLAEIVKATSGQSLREFTTGRIFGPLGMSRTFFFDDVKEVVPDRANSYGWSPEGSSWRRELLNFDNVGATSLLTTVEDLAKWGGNFGRPTVGDRALLDQVTTPGTLNNGTKLHYGFGLDLSAIGGRKTISHSGSDAGFRAYFAYFPESDLSVAILANTPIDTRAKLIAIANIYLPPVSAKTRPTEIQPTPETVSALAGDFLSPRSGAIHLDADEDRLHFRRYPGGPSQAVVFRSNDTFELVTGGRHPFRAVKGPSGQVTTLEILDPDAPIRYERFERVKPSNADLSELAGDYRSTELDITYTISPEAGHLEACSLWSVKSAVFIPVVKDRFDGATGTVTFERDSQGRAIGLRWSVDRARRLLFRKVVASPP